ncbi:hypothetical protein [Blastococcus sp. TF02A-30]|uniref:hypothetical protein n=1 Tax=Blastococcus sp. TF02A-30 TaxID=2250580 RepID=UPI000DE8B6AD|nr:hypothetical protein [Blastococcus sp. TF02A-30]RBY93062.1 hypothetical protein DQ241_03305 [Blastococcus sp. TF02A-30]
MDPLVAAALAGRAPEAGGAHREGTDHSSSEGEVGWPEPPAPGGGGLGWPGDLDREGGPSRGQHEGGPGEPAPAPAARRGWRRLFGISRAA